MSGLVKYEAARAALAEAHRIDEVKDIRDKAEAMAAYARQAKDTELIAHATEIKVRAERRCGELLIDMAKTGQRAAPGDPAKATSNGSTSLARMGLSRDDSSRYQQVASIPAEKFEEAVATAKATEGQVTTAFMLRQAKGQEKDKLSKKRRIQEVIRLLEKGHNPEQIAEQQGVNVQYVRKLLIESGVQLGKKGRRLDSNKIVRESVAALSGIAHGLRLVGDIDIDAAEASDLLAELRASMKALRALETTLKEIHG